MSPQSLTAAGTQIHRAGLRAGYSLGAQAGQEPLARLAADAGFASFRRVAETPFNIVYEARR